MSNFTHCLKRITFTTTMVLFSFITTIDAYAASNKVKYVFLFIGDGLGTSQRTLTSEYYDDQLTMNLFPVQGVTSTAAANRFITDSGAAGTALSSGVKTNVGYIGVDPALKPLKTIAEMARDKGMKVGIVSSVSIDHATPASFYAHVKSRNMYHEIAHALVASNFDYFAGGGLKDSTGKNALAKNPDYKIQGDALELAIKNGYTYTNNKADFEKLNSKSGKIIAVNEWLQDGAALPYVLDMTKKDITLAEFTAKGIEVLENEKGFFMMVEGGKIDWAAHANDALTTISNVKSFDLAVAEAVKFAKKYPEETLIIVTGDHETGGMTIGFSGTKYESYFDILGAQNVSFQKFTDEVIPAYRERNATFNDIKPVITRDFGLKFESNIKNDRLLLSDAEIEMLEKAYERSIKEIPAVTEEEYIMYSSDYDPLTLKITHILNRKAGIGWTTYSHTGVPVMTSAMGPQSDLFYGFYDNIEIPRKIMSVLGFDSTEVIK